MKQHKAVCCRRLLPVLIVSLGLMGCQLAPAPSAPTETTPPTSVAETRTLFPTWTPTATALPATPFPTPAATATPQPTATSTPLPVCAPIWQRPLSKTEPLHDLILFISTAHAPFAPAEVHQRTPSTHLWAIAADGRESERLSTTEDMLFIRPNNGFTVDLLVTQPYSMETDFVRQHALLPECESMARELPCTQVQFSPTGTWAVYFWGEETCGRGIAALDLRTDDTRVITETGGHSFTFLTDEMILIGTGHCEGGELALVDLHTGEQNTLGKAGPIQWNALRTAFAVNVHLYLGWGSSVWGYDVAQEWQFLPPTKRDTEESQPQWTPTGDHLLYQQRVISYTMPAKAALTLGPQQIVIVDATTGEQQILLSDPTYDYHLCTAYEVCPWEGDFIEVRRIPYRQNVLDLEPDFNTAAVNCTVYGFRCADPVERFALNWRTGELVPWDARPAAAEVPTVTPTPTPAATTPQPITPNLDQPAFYTAADGTYTLRLGGDKRSLWCVPTGGEPVLWVNTGANFTYVP
ncbi:MAG: hypothetical protein JXR84_16025 [Anaerolineae bacterium]|nr:hypothetical protein [Anaerolineae bacterium]